MTGAETLGQPDQPEPPSTAALLMQCHSGSAKAVGGVLSDEEREVVKYFLMKHHHYQTRAELLYWLVTKKVV